MFLKFTLFIAFSGVATKEFFIGIADTVDGPWEKIVEGQLHFDNGIVNFEGDFQKFPFTPPLSGHFIRFTAVNCWGGGCGLQYITASTSEDSHRLNDYRISTKGSFPS